ncbi:helix-turn-helix transcriptional regulator [Nesterenkonia sp. NBAIMH1]|uniref:helix-turn-helix transcriptional regulator n=1 Tax=Nesterenkonia sp. NBAIMH1 TaxID=2600320 RepID=UPI00211056E8|nr:helix-turn-helix transcriptional regulator [Nesterenkonia sp. NBAIMH1]
MPLQPDPDLDQLRHIIGKARVDAGMTLEQLAEASGVGRQTIVQLSNGKYYGDLNTWLKLSRALKVGLDELTAPVWHKDKE